jgi:thiol:disulfide interchange protein DsbD
MPMIRGDAGEKPRGIAWLPFTEEIVANAARDGKSVVIDFSAAWCLPCHELDRKTFSRPEVVRLSSNFIPLKVDLTKSGAAENKIKNDYNVRGVPAIIFIDRTGTELKALRVTGFIEEPEFRKRLEALAGVRPER